jgi:hypothetical protein
MMVPMYIDTIPNRNSPPAVLLRQGTRRGKKIDKETLLNLRDWPKPVVEGLRRLLRGETLVSVDDLFETERSIPHGHVQAVLGTIRRLGVDRLLASEHCRERDLVVAMIAERLLYPCSKLATTRLWHTTTLAEELAVGDAEVDELYDALDWLLDRQERIEKKLARRHLGEGATVFYDVSSSSYEGRTCELARRGYNRDGEKGLLSIVYGVMTDGDGRPVAVEVYPGNTADPKTVPDQVETLRERFGLKHVVLVGDRGMLTHAQIEQLRQYPQLGWISTLRSPAIRKLVDSGAIQLSLFDQQNLAEITSPDYPGERLVVCYNPLLAEERRRTRESLVAATETEFEKIAAAVRRRTKTPLGKDEIGVKVGRVCHRYKVAKHFHLTIEDNRFHWQRNPQSLAREQALDGLYVVRTSEPVERLSSDNVVRQYKDLRLVEQAFRCLKGMDILVRPIRHRTDDHVRAHIFLCFLAYYVQWHMRKAWAPLLFEDEELDANRWRRDPVAPAQPSRSVRRKKATRLTSDGFPVHSFDTLLADLSTRCRNLCRTKLPKHSYTFTQITQPTPLQRRALDLLGLCSQ